MGKRRWKSELSLVLAAALAAGSMAYATPMTLQAATGARTEGTTEAGDAAEISGNAWYIDAANGNDKNDGKSPETAWKTLKKLKLLRLKAGEKVLLKAGCTWNGEKLMLVEAEGTPENPVVLGRYGEGDDPVINGQGSPWLDMESASSLKKEDVAAVHIKNSKYITVQNLEVTNWENDSSDLMGETGNQNKDVHKNPTGRAILYDQSKKMLTGILVENRDAGDLPGVVIKDNYVHDVNGYMSQNGKEGDKKGSGGIMALVTGGKTESYFTDLKITGNKVEKVCHEAIYMESCWAARKLVGGAGSQQAGSLKWVGWPNVYVAHNYVNDVAGDGIVLINADGGVAEHNLVTKSASEDWYYGRNPAHAAIWMWDCNNVTMQYNEAGYTESTQDGMAFDCDYGNQNVMYQYNYSHDNKGGFWMACPGPYYTVNAVVRYNVSVNDGLFDGSRIIHVGEDGSIGNQVYNNTMFWKGGYEIRAVEQGSWINTGQKGETSGTDIFNNIFCGDSVMFTNNEGIRYDNNCVWGSGKDLYPVEEDGNAVLADPKFTDTLGYTAGAFAMTAEGGKVTLGAADGFKLQDGSPCINAARDYLPVPNETFDAVKDETDPVTTHITLEYKDYEGNTVPNGSEGSRSMDIGAFQYQGEMSVKDTDKSKLQSLVDVVSSYKAEDYTAETWQGFESALEKGKQILEDATVSQEAVDSAESKLKQAVAGLKPAASVRPGTPEEDNVLKNAGEAIRDNSGFETTTTDWGVWHSVVEVTKEKFQAGHSSLKVALDEENTSGSSELGNVPVQPSTTYIFEGWIDAGEENASNIKMEAKHHHNVVGGENDILLNNQPLSAIAQGEAVDGWQKFHMEFTTQEYDKVSVSINLENTTGPVHLDEVVIYPTQVNVEMPVIDKAALEEALALVPDGEEADYTAASWKAYQDAAAAAELARVDISLTQEDVNQRASALQEAYNALTERGNKYALKGVYSYCSTWKREDYLADGWAAFQTALKAAKDVLDNEDALQAEVDTARENLVKARDALQEIQKEGVAPTPTPTPTPGTTPTPAPGETPTPTPGPQDPVEKKGQKISYTSSYKKTFGAKAFKLNAKVTEGDGALSYKSSDKKVATVKDGKVTIKGTGVCTITITAKETDAYKEKSVKVTVKVSPKKVTIKSIKSLSGKKMKVTWMRTAQASGYEVQYSLDKKFKSKVGKVSVADPSSSSIKKISTKNTTIKKLKKGKKYYVRVRAYKTVDKKAKLNGAWSAVKTSKKIK